MQVNRNITMTWWERIYLMEIFRGIFITSKHLSVNLFGFIAMLFSKNRKRKIFTVYYPEERVSLPPSYRGRPVLVADENRTERCVACGLCEKICPASCIRIQPAETADEKERYPASFTLDLARCVFCGFCEEVCPKTALVMSSEFEIANYDRRVLLLDKKRLLMPVGKLNQRLDYIGRIYGKSNY